EGSIHDPVEQEIKLLKEEVNLIKNLYEKEVKSLRQEFDSFKKLNEKQKKINMLITEICTMLSIDSNNNLLRIHNALIPNNNTNNLTNQKEIIKSICDVLDIKYLENNKNQNLIIFIYKMSYIFKNLGIHITVHEPRDIGTVQGVGNPRQGVCKDYPNGKTIRFYVHNGKQSGFSTTDHHQNLINQLQITENYIT
ncbi:25514_t:CDS:2, partial [Dentiscutata erythropus]